MKKVKNALLILAGGTGNRFDKKSPKQFHEILICSWGWPVSLALEPRWRHTHDLII